MSIKVLIFVVSGRPFSNEFVLGTLRAKTCIIKKKNVKLLNIKFNSNSE